VRIAELSRRSGVSIPTIKYYLREGLLPPGEPLARNQARYGPGHLARLRLIRALREVGGLSVAAAGAIVATLDEWERGGLTAHEVMGRAHRAVTPPVGDHDAADPEWARARADADAFVRDLGWHVSEDAPARARLAEVIYSLRRLGHPELLDCLPAYASAALAVAEVDVELATSRPDAATMMSAVVVGTVLGEALLSAMRLLAHEHVSAARSDGRAGRRRGDLPSDPGLKVEGRTHRTERRS
jgi:DNA-binding transcriptional MerR regulator